MFGKSLAALAVTIGFLALPVAPALAVAEFETEKYPATIKGENTSKFSFKTGAGTIECSIASLEGELAGKSSEVTLTPSFSGCKFFGFINATFSPGTCKYKLHVTGTSPSFTGTIDIVPPGCTGFQFSAAGCTVTIPPQTGLSTISFVNSSGPPPTITTTVNVSGITYTTSASCVGGSGTFSNGIKNVTESLRAFFSGVQKFFQIHP